MENKKRYFEECSCRSIAVVAGVGVEFSVNVHVCKALSFLKSGKNSDVECTSHNNISNNNLKLV